MRVAGDQAEQGRSGCGRRERQRRDEGDAQVHPARPGDQRSRGGDEVAGRGGAGELIDEDVVAAVAGHIGELPRDEQWQEPEHTGCHALDTEEEPKGRSSPLVRQVEIGGHRSPRSRAAPQVPASFCHSMQGGSRADNEHLFQMVVIR